MFSVWFALPLSVLSYPLQLVEVHCNFHTKQKAGQQEIFDTKKKNEKRKKKQKQTMTEESNAWVFDSLIGFLHGPVWNAPLQTFIEEKSLSKH